MRKYQALVAAAALVVTGACGTQDDMDVDTAPGTEISPAPATTPEQTTDMSVATGQFESAGESAVQVQGTAELRRQGTMQEDGLELQVQLMGMAEGEHAWHIHEGTCENVGSVVLPLSDAPGQDGITGDLEIDDNGVVDRTVTIDAEEAAMLTGGTGYSVNVHTGDSDNPGAPIACATLDLPTDLWTAGDATANPSTGGY